MTQSSISPSELADDIDRLAKTLNDWAASPYSGGLFFSPEGMQFLADNRDRIIASLRTPSHPPANIEAEAVRDACAEAANKVLYKYADRVRKSEADDDFAAHACLIASEVRDAIRALPLNPPSEASQPTGGVVEAQLYGNQVPPYLSAPAFEYRDEQRAVINGCLYLRADFAASLTQQPHTAPSGLREAATGMIGVQRRSDENGGHVVVEFDPPSASWSLFNTLSLALAPTTDPADTPAADGRS